MAPKTHPLWASHRQAGSFWFRLFGWGLVVTDRRRYRALFSERNGLVRVLRSVPGAFGC